MILVIMDVKKTRLRCIRIHCYFAVLLLLLKIMRFSISVRLECLDSGIIFWCVAQSFLIWFTPINTFLAVTTKQ